MLRHLNFLLKFFFPNLNVNGLRKFHIYNYHYKLELLQLLEKHLILVKYIIFI